MRPGFRFPRSTVFLMTVVLAGVILAIKKAHDLTAFRLDINFASTLVSFFVAFLLMCAAGGAVWGILFALRRSGVHRLDSIQTWPERH
jgi:hypothetical protein